MTPTAQTRARRKMARYLYRLKSEHKLSYAEIARRSDLSASRVNHYLAGDSMPKSVQVIKQLGRACGAGEDELAELHRLWIDADAERRRQPSELGGRPEVPGEGNEHRELPASPDPKDSPAEQPSPPGVPPLDSPPTVAGPARRERPYSTVFSRWAKRFRVRRAR